MRVEKTEKVIYTIYETLEEAIGQAMEFVGGRDQIAEYTGSDKVRSSESHLARPDFIGRNFETWGEVEDAVHESWERGHQELERMIERLEKLSIPDPVDRKRRLHFDEMDGDEIDLDRLRSGQPFWRVCTRQQTTGSQNVTIVIDVTTPYGQDSINVLWRGAAGIALAKKLEEHGYRAEIWLVHKSAAYANRSQSQMCAINLKRCQDPLDLSGLINAVSGWFYRSVGFFNMLANCYRDEMQRGFLSSYGNCQIPVAKDLDQVTPDEDRIVVTSAWDFRAAANIVEGELKKFAQKNTFHNN